MEKEHQPESMATITMKPEYPPSEVYSTSEPPPAYRQRESSSVQIARIIGLTVVAASFILGAFILASSWVSARSSCHQLEQLDAMLDKELALEGRAYGNDALLADEPLPVSNAHALHASAPSSTSAPTVAIHTSTVIPAKDHIHADALSQAESNVDENKLQKIDEKPTKVDSTNSESIEDSSETDSSAEEDDQLDSLKTMLKLPMQLNLDELVGAFLANNNPSNNPKGRMNCVVERRRDDPERRFPFNILGPFAPRAAHAERVAIICHGGDEPRQIFPEPQSQVFAFPLSGPVRMPLKPQPERPMPMPMPAEPRMPFGPMGQRPSPQFILPMPWDSSEEQVGAAPPPREMRIQVQRVIALPSMHNMPPPPEAMGPFPPPPAPSVEQNELPIAIRQFIQQRPAPSQEIEQPEVRKIQMEGSPVQMNLPWGLTPEDLHVIHRTAEDAAASQQREQQIDNDMQEVKNIVNTLAVAAEAEAQAQAQAEEQQRKFDDEVHEDAPEPQNAVPQMARMPRTLLLPKDMPMEERPHYMQPRSVRDGEELQA